MKTDSYSSTYSGTPSEDFILFRDEFREAAKDNRIAKTDQARILQGVLTGTAVLFISISSTITLVTPQSTANDEVLNSTIRRCYA